MSTIHRIYFLIIILYPLACNAQTQLKPAITTPIPVSDLVGYPDYPPSVKTLISNASTLTRQNLTYIYGSADPKRHGMDCSGTIYYLLNNNGVKDVPRSANDMYRWVEKNSTFNHVQSSNFNSTDFSKLKPGDLLFWSGTYKTGNSSLITHVMLYLGQNSNHEPLMFGSSDGRTYQNKKMWGVSVFDFKLPATRDTAKFLGYSCIPQLTCN